MLCCAKSLQSFPTLSDPVECSPPAASVQGILQARILQWVAIPFSRGSSQLRDWTWVSCVSCIGRWGLSCGSSGKGSTCNAGDLGSIPELGIFPGEGKGYPLQYSGLVTVESMGSQRVGHDWATFTFTFFTTSATWEAYLSFKISKILYLVSQIHVHLYIVSTQTISLFRSGF